MLNVFLDMVVEPPQCLMWLPLMHHMATVENGTQTKNQKLSLISFELFLSFVKFSAFVSDTFICCFSTIELLYF